MRKIWISLISILLGVVAITVINAWRQNGGTVAQAHLAITPPVEFVKLEHQADTTMGQAAAIITPHTIAQTQTITNQIESGDQLAQAYRLAAQSNSVLDNSYQGLVHSVLLATESLSQTYTVEGEIALRRGLLLLPRPLDPAQYSFVSEALSTTKVITQVISPDGQWVATSDENGTVQVLTAITGTEVIRIPSGQIKDMLFSPNSERLAIVDENIIYFWNVESGRKLGQIVHDGPVNQIAISPDGQRLAIAGWPIAAQVWETYDKGSSWREIARMGYKSEYPEEMNAVAFSPDNQVLATKGGPHKIQVWGADTTPQAAKITHLNPVCRVLFSQNGQWLVAKSENYTVTRILNTTTLQEIPPPENDTMVYDQKKPLCDRWPVIVGLDTAFSPDNHWLATSGANHTVRLWDLLGQEVAVLQHDDRVNQVTFSKDNQWLATASDDGTARVWDVVTGRELIRLEHGTFINGSGVEQIRPVNTVAISPDKRLIATGSRELARLWDSNTGREISRFENEPLVSPSMTFNWHVNEVFFSSDGQWLVGKSTASLVTKWGYQARIWNVTTGEEIIKIKDLADPKSTLLSGKLGVENSD